MTRGIRENVLVGWFWFCNISVMKTTGTICCHDWAPYQNTLSKGKNYFGPELEFWSKHTDPELVWLGWQPWHLSTSSQSILLKNGLGQSPPCYADLQLNRFTEELILIGSDRNRVWALQRSTRQLGSLSQTSEGSLPIQPRAYCDPHSTVRVCFIFIGMCKIFSLPRRLKFVQVHTLA